ncbi:MAG: Carbon monoxide dehydrogenase [Candidatus Acidoferrum typicum]|nr:Carbon monoxide dehydrogenase [Candidatus Acidoferrum typicum]
MRANPTEYELVAPGTLQEALALHASEPGSWLPIAGGTDLMVLYAAGRLQSRKLISIAALRELRNIEVASAEVRVGAGCTYTDLRQHPVITKEFPLLARAAAWTGGIANQNRGTLGGNIANASPAGDSLPVLLAYDADLILVSASGERRIPYRTFHTGYKKTLLAPDELIHSICMPRNLSGYKCYARKVGARNAQAISKVFLAAMVRISNATIKDIRLAAGSVGPVPIRLAGTERALAGQPINDSLLELAGKVMAEEIQPIDDIRSTAGYRTVVLRNLLGEFLQSLPGARFAS